VTDARIITGVSVAHERASVDAIAATGAPTDRQAVDALLAEPGVSEAFALQTCNRAEAYVVTESPGEAREALTAFAGDAPDEAVRPLDHETALRHLLRVAAGLESLVLGEDQILGQFGDAVVTAREAGAVGDTLDEALTKAVHVGERAREETAINEGVVSLGSAAVRLADEERDLAGATALVVGAGEMGTTAAKALADAVDELLVANRTPERGAHLVDRVDVAATAADLAALPTALSTADVVVTATGSSEPVVDRDALAGAGETFVVDIGQPRDVDPAAAALPAVELRDLDDLEAVTDETLARRQAAAERVEAMVDQELEHLLVRYKRKRADRVIAGMHRGAERIKRREVGEAISRLEAEGDLTEAQREIVESMADALVSQLLAAPTRSLRDAAEEDDWSTIHTALQLFDPSVEGGAALLGDASPDELPAEMRRGMPAAVLERFAAEDD
jgi:glutamyl-tRNA reductase